MPDRLIRDELLDSIRFTDERIDNDCRVAWLALTLTADDLGNTEGHPNRLLKLWRDFQIDTASKVSRVIERLAEVELIECYEVDGKRFVHIPRFNQRLRTKTPKHPLPPEKKLPKSKHLHKKCLTDDRHVPSTSQTPVGQLPPKEEKEEKEEKRRNAREEKGESSSSSVPPDGMGLGAHPPAPDGDEAVPMPDKVREQFAALSGKLRVV